MASNFMLISSDCDTTFFSRFASSYLLFVKLDYQITTISFITLNQSARTLAAPPTSSFVAETSSSRVTVTNTVGNSCFSNCNSSLQGFEALRSRASRSSPPLSSNQHQTQDQHHQGPSIVPNQSDSSTIIINDGDHHSQYHSYHQSQNHGPHPEVADWLQRQLLIMRLKERIVILLIGACCVLCVLFVIQAKIVDDSAWEFPKHFK